MLFRIEDVSGFEPNLRTYDIEEVEKPIIKKMEIDQYIASKIRAEINGHNKRDILSYSKSLAVCLLKYNKFNDNELHIYPRSRLYSDLSFIWFRDEYGDEKCAIYCIEERLNKRPLPEFWGTYGKMQLLNFVIDVSDNKILDKYLRLYTNVGKRKIASPEKDKEVVVMCPPIDLIIRNYMDSVYVLYALQMKYEFLGYKKKELIDGIKQLPDEHFCYFPDTKEAIILIVEYMERYSPYEFDISKKIYKDVFGVEKNAPKCQEYHLYYDSILQLINIIKYGFEEAYSLSDYNDNVVSKLIWEVCSEFLEEQDATRKKNRFKRFFDI